MNRKRLVIAATSGAILGMALFLATPTTWAQTTEWKQCGGPGGALNADCPDCQGTCKGVGQRYKVCEQTGTGCTNSTAASCSGFMFTGGGDGTGCDGAQLGNCNIGINMCT